MSRANIIPAILAHTAAEFKKKFSRVKSFAPSVHIDVMDGVFVPNTTWADPAQVPKILGKTPFEVHLMVQDPHEPIRAWFAAGASRIIFHAESVHDETGVCEAFGTQCKNLMVAINPDTTLPRLFPAFGSFSQFMVMGVTPGFGGQPFAPGTLEKVRKLRETLHDAVISVDGGVKTDNFHEITAAGADTLVVGSAIMDAEDPEAAYEILTKR